MPITAVYQLQSDHRVRRSKTKRQMSSEFFWLFWLSVHCTLSTVAPERIVTLCDQLYSGFREYSQNKLTQWTLHNNRMESANQIRRHLPFPLRHSYSLNQMLPISPTQLQCIVYVSEKAEIFWKASWKSPASASGVKCHQLQF